MKESMHMPAHASKAHDFKVRLRVFPDGRRWLEARDAKPESSGVRRQASGLKHQALTSASYRNSPPRISTSPPPGAGQR